jgi:hypothetical protein
MKVTLGLLAYILPLAAFAWKPRVLARQQGQDTCLTQYTIEYDIAPTVIGQPVEVVTSIISNTTLTPEPFNVPITISNAPTLLSTVVTAYSTTTVTIVRTYVTLTSPYAGSVTSTSTIFNTADPQATTTYLVLVPGLGSSILSAALPLSNGISQSSLLLQQHTLDLQSLQQQFLQVSLVK